MIKKSNLFLPALLFTWSMEVMAFTCKVADTGQTMTSGSASVYVNLTPSLNVGQNLVVDISSSILCKNDAPNTRNDEVSMLSGSMFGGALENFSGSFRYHGNTYLFPLNGSTAPHNFTSGNFVPLDIQLFLTPISAASSVVIKGGTLFAQLEMFQRGSNISNGGNVYTQRFTWNLYALQDVVIPTGGCDVSSRNVTVNLPDYPGSMNVPVTVHCAKEQFINYYLSGTTMDSGNSIFANTASASPAQGIGVQMQHNGKVVAANSIISLGKVGPSAKDLGLTATYALLNGQVTAGNVQSIIGVTFVYQ